MTCQVNTFFQWRQLQFGYSHSQSLEIFWNFNNTKGCSKPQYKFVYVCNWKVGSQTCGHFHPGQSHAWIGFPTFTSPFTRPILESKGICAIFQKTGKKKQKMLKWAKYLKIWAKMYKIWKYFEKGQVICMLEKALPLGRFFRAATHSWLFYAKWVGC